MSTLVKVSAATAIIELFIAAIIATAVFAGAWSHLLLWAVLPCIASTFVAVLAAIAGSRVTADVGTEIVESEERIVHEVTQQVDHLATIIGHYVHDEAQVAAHLAELRRADTGGVVVRMPNRR
ncbi:hypothetical protein [Micromonospora sp. NPDC004704]